MTSTIKYFNTAYPGSMFPRKDGDGAYLEVADFQSQANNLVAAIKERDRMIEDMVPATWKVAIDDALVTAGLDCSALDEDPRAAIQRLLTWHETMVLDPSISERAQALIHQGRSNPAEPDMFWDNSDPEQSFRSIFEIVDDAYGQGSVNFGDVMTIQRALRFRNIKVRVIPVADDPEYPDYEVVEETK